MTMPVMEPDLDAAVLREWAHVIDDGPFASLCWGERMAFDNPETLTLMGALAAWTDRVRLVTTVIVPQLHDPVMLAKALATDHPGGAGQLRRRRHQFAGRCRTRQTANRGLVATSYRVQSASTVSRCPGSCPESSF